MTRREFRQRLAVGLALIVIFVLLSILVFRNADQAEDGGWIEFLALLCFFAAADRLVPLWPTWLDRRRQR